MDEAGGLYHVINRGNYREWIFESEGAKQAFERTLLEASERAGWILHAFCIMTNHYHLALDLPVLVWVREGRCIRKRSDDS